jgi:hypothetical protein
VKRVPTFALALVLVLAGYAWWATGVRPFTTLAYVLITLPSLAVLSVYAALGGFSPRRADVAEYYRARSASATWRNVGPWTGLLIAAIVLETIGLALGGRSPTVATLSTTADHLLVAHWGRWLLYDLWLAVGAGPLLRLSTRTRSRAA